MWDHSSLSMSLSVVVYRAWSRYKSGFLFLVRSFKFIRFFLSPSRLDLASQFLGLTIDKLRDSGAVIFSSCPVRIHPFSRVMLNYFTHYLRVINPAVTYKKFMSWSHDACVSRLSNMIITLKISFFSAFDLTQKSPLESRRELREWLDQMTCSQCRREADGRFLRRGWFSVGYFRRVAASREASLIVLSDCPYNHLPLPPSLSLSLFLCQSSFASRQFSSCLVSAALVSGKYIIYVCRCRIQAMCSDFMYPATPSRCRWQMLSAIAWL